jgi:hypothetical protein
MEPDHIVRLADRLRHVLSIEECTRVGISVSRAEWDALAKWLKRLEPMTTYPVLASPPPSSIQLLGIKVVVE